MRATVKEDIDLGFRFGDIEELDTDFSY